MAMIIAECCQNHKGDLSILKDMVWAAAEAGADFVKIQSMRADDLTFREEFEEGRVEDGVTKVIKRPFQPEYDRLKPLDLNDDAHRFFIEECQKAHIKPLTTPFSRSRIPFLASLGWKDIKLASYDCASYPMIIELKSHFSHIFLSTGSTYDSEIEQAAKILHGTIFTFLHCITIYPTPLNDLHLSRMDWLREFTSSVGFSDHSLTALDGIKASLGALYYGADVIERHFTILAPDATRDGPVSVNPRQLKEISDFAKLSKLEQRDHIVKNIPEYSQMIGTPRRSLSYAEKLNRDYYRGRFASKTKNGQAVYNWDASPVFDLQLK